jgi:hypothetical protein
MSAPEWRPYVRRAVCWMIVIPLASLVAYPLVYVMLPEHMAIRADLPQDLTVILLLNGVVVPGVAAMLYLRHRRRNRVSSGESRENKDTRDIY